MRDIELLAALGQVLEAEPAEPSVLEIERLHLAVSAAATASVFSTAGHRSLRNRLARPVPVLVAAMLTLASGGTAAAALTGASLPAPLRSVASAVGLPVDDTSVAMAKSVMADLQAALAAGDRVRIAADAGRLRDLIGTMSGGDRARIEPSAERLLAQATQVFGAAGAPKRPGTPASETRPAPSTSGTTTETPNTEAPSTDGPPTTTEAPSTDGQSSGGSDGNTTSGDTTTTTAATGAEQPSAGSDGAADTTSTTSSSSDTSTSDTNNAAPGN